MTAVSPLFAVEADSLFAEGRIDEALELCCTGMETFPEYAAAYVLTSKILSSLGRTDEAANIIKRGLTQSRRNEALRRIADEFGIDPYDMQQQEQDKGHASSVEEIELITEENPKKIETPQVDDKLQISDYELPNTELQIPLRRIGARHANYTQPLRWRANDSAIIPMPEFPFSRKGRKRHSITFALRSPQFPPFTYIRLRANSEKDTNGTDEIKSEIAEIISEKNNCTPLEELAQRLERARIPVPREETGATDNAAVPEFVTDTMAAIYERQGALTQALKAYQILARNKPEKLFLYQAKINEITLKIKN